ncbi:amidase family protein [Janibacter sp. GS2]|uniref:amidase family protein n=1 Tax=Janibacter sp. GS2 TaxID=3442646 RepID=UPI003EC0DC00
MQTVRAARGRVVSHDGDVRAWVHLVDDPLVRAEQVDASTEVLPLRGLPVGIKDIIDVEGLPTRCGSEATTSPEPLTANAACVNRLEQWGAVVIGKTATTEYGYFRPAATRNPAAPGCTPGGSSSGSAASVASGQVPLALGTQTAGSTTRPASFCGVAGLVMAHGSTDLAGVTGLSPTLDSLGVLARSVRDLALVHRLFAGTSAAPPAAGPAVIHVWRGSSLSAIDPSMAAAVDLAASALVGAGHRVEEFPWDDHVHTLAADQPVVMAYEAARERAALRDVAPLISQSLRELLDQGRRTTEDDYRAAIARCHASRTDLEHLLSDRRVIVGPAAPGPAPWGLEATGSPDLSRPWQALGLPVVAVPGIRAADGRPLGIQVIGLPGLEEEIFAVATALEHRLQGATV